MFMIIGIDPGQSGGIAIIFDNGNIEADKMPETERDVFALLEPSFEPHVVFLESVHSMPGQGISSTFKFGRGYGFLRGVITALKYPLHDVTPQRWQKALGCLSGGNKNITKQKAQQLYPQLKITHATADAILIATYGKMFADGRIKV
jgi:crossover junction endodeoxyribonuclease RuvC